MAVIKDKANQSAKVRVMPVSPTPQNITFSFRYLVSNKKYSFKYFRKNTRNSSDAYEALIDRMQQLCKQNMNSAKASGKISGCEPIPYKSFSSNMQSILDHIDIVSRDSFLTVFRFGGNDYRLICKTDLQHPNILHVIAFDFDFSAYSHG